VALHCAGLARATLLFLDGARSALGRAMQGAAQLVLRGTLGSTCAHGLLVRSQAAAGNQSPAPAPVPKACRYLPTRLRRSPLL